MSPTAKDGEGERVVAVIDDDESVREALRGLFQSVGLVTELYGSVQAFLDAGRMERRGASSWTSACRVAAALSSRRPWPGAARPSRSCSSAAMSTSRWRFGR
jgi:DNA-binding NtrC family response regulator